MLLRNHPFEFFSGYAIFNASLGSAGWALIICDDSGGILLRLPDFTLNMHFELSLNIQEDKQSFGQCTFKLLPGTHLFDCPHHPFIYQSL